MADLNNKGKIQPFFIAAAYYSSEASDMRSNPQEDPGRYLSSDNVRAFHAQEDDDQITVAFVSNNASYYIPAPFATVKAMFQDHGYEFVSAADLKKKEEGGNKPEPRRTISGPSNNL